jgi:hypothetical protein
MSATDQTTDQIVEPIPPVVDPLEPEPTISLDLTLSEAEALHGWLLKPAADGSTSLDNPLVSRALARLGRTVDTVRASVTIRRELQDAGIGVDHLSDEQLHDLGRRVTSALSGDRD